MATTHTGTAMPTNRVYFIDEDQAGGVLFALNEEVALRAQAQRLAPTGQAHAVLLEQEAVGPGHRQQVDIMVEAPGDGPEFGAGHGSLVAMISWEMPVDSS